MARRRTIDGKAQSVSRRFNLKTFRLTFAVGSLLLLLAAAFAQTAPTDAILTSNPVFQQNCARCHGKAAEGRHFGGPSLVSEKATVASSDHLRDIITNGKSHMPKYAGKLTPGEIDMLVQQIEAIRRK
jgi:mono/diheme cytochrome c family protein